MKTMELTCFRNTCFLLFLYTIQVLIIYVYAADYRAVFNTKGNASTLVTVDECAKLLPDCAKLCVKHGCLSFGYNQDQNICRVYSGVLITATENEASGFRLFTKRTVFEKNRKFELHNLANGIRLLVDDTEIFDIVKSDDYVHIRCRKGEAIVLNNGFAGCRTKATFTGQMWSLIENLDMTVTFQNFRTLKCLSLNETSVIGKDCSPCNPLNSWIVVFL